jgi:hypothetical protein
MRTTKTLSLGGFAAALALAAGLATPARAQVVVGPFTAPASFYVIPRDGAIVLSWSAVLHPTLVGYNVYRRDSGRAADQNALLNAAPIILTSIVDAGADGKGLKNGSAFIYSVKAVFLGTDGKPVEGPATREIVGTANAPVKGIFTLYDIGTLNPGTAAVDASNVLTITGAGADIWDNVDTHSFLAVPVSGDFQVTIKLNERPAKATPGANGSGKVGLQIKADLQSGSPYALVFASIDRSPDEYLFEGGKKFGGGDATLRFSAGPGIASADAKFPVWLRLVRKGSIIQAYLSIDGTNFQQIGVDQDYGTALPAVVQVGVAATAHAEGNYVSGKLDYASLKIENAP